MAHRPNAPGVEAIELYSLAGKTRASRAGAKAVASAMRSGELRIESTREEREWRCGQSPGLLQAA